MSMHHFSHSGKGEFRAKFRLVMAAPFLTIILQSSASTALLGSPVRYKMLPVGLPVRKKLCRKSAQRIFLATGTFGWFPADNFQYDGPGRAWRRQRCHEPKSSQVSQVRCIELRNGLILGGVAAALSVAALVVAVIALVNSAAGPPADAPLILSSLKASTASG